MYLSVFVCVYFEARVHGRGRPLLPFMTDLASPNTPPPDYTQRFEGIDAEFKELMKDAATSQPSVVCTIYIHTYIYLSSRCRLSSVFFSCVCVSMRKYIRISTYVCLHVYVRACVGGRYGMTHDPPIPPLWTQPPHPPQLEACTAVEGRLELLTSLGGRLELCQRSLNEYLDTKKKLFPRFYFVSNVRRFWDWV